MTRYQYGVLTSAGDHVTIEPTKGIAESVARDWVISPLRTGPRKAQTMRRRDWTHPWEVLNTWTTPEELVDDGPEDEPEDDEWTNREGMPEFNGSFR